MTTKTITGTITNGYTLSSAYSALTVTGAGVITGLPGAPGFSSSGYGGAGYAGGTALTVLGAATVVNQGALTGGAGGVGGYGYLEGGKGGAGGGGLYLATGANLTNTGTTAGGAGGNGGASEFGHLGRRPAAGGVGGAGGVGVTLAGTGTITNGGVLRGGVGGKDGSGLYDQYMQTPGANIGGAGVLLSGAGSLINNGGTIVGGAGGSGGTGYFVGAPGGAGGAGVLASCGGASNDQTISNLAGAILGGAGGAGGTGHTIGAAGQVGDGVVVTAPGGAGNYAFSVTVENGGKTSPTALISGAVGVYGGTITQTSVPAVTVINYGTIQGTGGVAVSLHCSADRLVDEAGSTLIGTAIGGRGILELGAGTGTISGLGTSFTGFANMIIDSGGSWALSGTNNFAGFTGVALENGASLNGGLTLGGPNHQLVIGAGASIIGLVNGASGQLQLPDGSVITGVGATGTVSGGGSATFSGFGAYSIGQGAYFNGTNTVAANHLLAATDGVHAGTSSPLTLTNAGSILGAGGVSVLLSAAADRLIADAGSFWYGAVKGGGGTLELASGTGTITGLGATGTLSGPEAMTFSGFGSYVIDTGATWTLVGTNTLAANQTVTNFGHLNGTATLGAASDRLILESGCGLTSVSGGGGTLELASGAGTITGLGATGTVSGAEALTFSGFGAYVIDAGTSWTLTGTNTLAASQTLMTAGTMTGAAGAAGYSSAKGNGGGGGAGGLGIAVAATGTVTVSGTLQGGAGGSGGFGYHYGGAGGGGANGADLAGGGILTNTGTVAGGAGGTGGAAYYDSPGLGGAGGVGVALAGAGTVTNTGGTISGGAGGVGGGATAGYHDSSAGGSGGAGVTLAGVATLTNTGGTIAGGVGGKGGSGYTNGGNGGGGGVAILATGAATISNTGAILGGGGGAGGSASGSRHHAGAAGAAADAIVLMAGGVVTNGAKAATTALISGLVGIYAGPTGAATVTNFGSIQGTGGVAVQFKSSADVLVVESGSTWIGSVQGGGGLLDLAGGTGAVTGIGSTGTVSGAEAMTFSGFGSYEFGAGTWTLTGTDTLAAGKALIDNATVSSNGALSLSGQVSGKGALTVSGGTAAIDTGAVLTLATVSLTGGATSLTENLTFKGAFNEGVAATLTLGGKDKLTLSGAATLGGLINGAGTVVVANAAVSGLTIGGTDVLSDTGKATQTGALTIGDATSAKAGLSIAAGATWTINGAVGIAHGTATNSSLKVAGTLIKSGATGTSVINPITTDTGLIEVAVGTLDVSNKLSGTGVLKIDAGATLEIDTTIASSLTATFDGAGATLAIKTPATFGATIAGFAVGDTLDLLGRKATGATINGSDQLVIVNGANTIATLQLTGPYSGAAFTIGSDGKGGTNVTMLTAASIPPPAAAAVSPAPSPHDLIAAMASLGPGAASAAPASSPSGLARPTLLVPRQG